jgi:uncharacterized protein YjbJ (UPF0337 family)
MRRIPAKTNQQVDLKNPDHKQSGVFAFGNLSLCKKPIPCRRCRQKQAELALKPAWPAFCLINLAGACCLGCKRYETKTHKIMNTLHLKGDWNIAKGKLKQKYAQLTDKDLTYVEGREDELVGRIQKRTGDTKEAVQAFIDDCFAEE